MTGSFVVPRSYALGVDLGTTSVAAAVARGEDDQPSMVALGDHAVAMPAVAFLEAGGRVRYGESAVRRAAADPGRAAVGFKRRLGDPTPLRLGGHTRSAARLVAGLLKEVLDTVSAAEGAMPARVVITHPATWGPLRRGILEAVARESGVEELGLVPEPVAAALHLARRRRFTGSEVVAVYDLGGGTFDLTVVRVRPEHVEVLGQPEGVERLGGLDFDDALVDHVDHLVGNALSDAGPADPDMSAVRARVRQDCVLAKEYLSTATTASVPVFLPGGPVRTEITRERFEELIRVRVESTVGVAERTIRSAGLTPDALAGVLLAGGGSRIPLVSRMLADQLGRPLLTDVHPKFAVALGAARIAAHPGAWAAAVAGPPVTGGLRPAEPVRPAEPGRPAEPVRPAEGPAGPARRPEPPPAPSRRGSAARLLAATSVGLALAGVGTYSMLSGSPWPAPAARSRAEQDCRVQSCGPRGGTVDATVPGPQTRRDPGIRPGPNTRPDPATAPPPAIGAPRWGRPVPVRRVPGPVGPRPSTARSVPAPRPRAEPPEFTDEPADPGKKRSGHRRNKKKDRYR